jgi:hypothetical protein
MEYLRFEGREFDEVDGKCLWIPGNQQVFLGLRLTANELGNCVTLLQRPSEDCSQ